MSRARATEPGRDPQLHRGVRAGPLRAPQPRARENTRGWKGFVFQKAISSIYLHRLGWRGLANDAVKHANHCVGKTTRVPFLFFFLVFFFFGRLVAMAGGLVIDALCGVENLMFAQGE